MVVIDQPSTDSVNARTVERPAGLQVPGVPPNPLCPKAMRDPEGTPGSADPTKIGAGRFAANRRLSVLDPRLGSIGHGTANGCPCPRAPPSLRLRDTNISGQPTTITGITAPHGKADATPGEQTSPVNRRGRAPGASSLTSQGGRSCTLPLHHRLVSFLIVAPTTSVWKLSTQRFLCNLLFQKPRFSM